MRSPEKVRPLVQTKSSSDTEDESFLLRTKTVQDLDKENDAPQKRKTAIDLDACSEQELLMDIQPLKERPAPVKKSKSVKK
jgi:hypothetical protein